MVSCGHRLSRYSEGASRDLCERTSACVFSPATCIFAELAYFDSASAARCALSFAVLMSLAAQKAAVLSAYMNALVPGNSWSAATRGADHNSSLPLLQKFGDSLGWPAC